MFPRWFYCLMIAGYLANLCATIPHVHPPGDFSRPHVHTDWLLGEAEEEHAQAHAHGHAHAESHDHGQEAHGPAPSADRPEAEHDRDCVFLAVSGTAITAGKTASPEMSGAVAVSSAGSSATASLLMTLGVCVSTHDLHETAAPHCARFLELRTLRI